MQKSGCIFCFGTADRRSVEHILPESLGGKEWACLPKGIVCSKCNNYFGTKVEPTALASFPFLPFRLFLNLPTKKNRAPTMPSRLGLLRAAGVPGLFGLDPENADIENLIADGKCSQFITTAEVDAPESVCRLLLKMGLEVVANDNPQDARLSKFDSARKAASAPAVGSTWWFVMQTNHQQLFEKFRRGVATREWLDHVQLGVVEEEGAELFRCELLDLIFIVPLEDRILPPAMNDLPEPDYRLITAHF